MSTRPTADERALYANHRRFLEAQRGPLDHHDGFDTIAGDIASFQIAMLHEPTALETAARARPTIFAPPWAAIPPGDGAVSRLTYLLTHMRLDPGALGPAAPSADLRVDRARSDDEICIFTEIQSAGFAPEPAKGKELYDWFIAKNLCAYREADQAYYILTQRGEPVSALLTVDTGDALGIYAVATPPALRRRGLSTHLLRSVCADAGDRIVCLQAMRGSDAERLYGTLGFREVFVVDVWESAVFEE